MESGAADDEMVVLKGLRKVLLGGTLDQLASVACFSISQHNCRFQICFFLRCTHVVKLSSAKCSSFNLSSAN